ncbi:MAG: D-aminoacyl-tRNA deacylase [Gammaproteobacteria bacterium]|nr:D-aminoacyl-tRNA deacylase [Gammaproteobacteria bacterium]
MVALLQRVESAYVEVEGTRIAAIGGGLLAFIGVERQDTDKTARRLAERVTGYRIFPDAAGRMNLGLDDAGGQLLAVPQFTLAADTRKGMRPSFTPAASPAAGERLFQGFCAACRDLGVAPASGRFGADMRVGLVNDGPVTFWLQVGEPS